MQIRILLLLIICGFNTVQAQIFPFRTYSIEDGLSESVVHAMYQDSDGYLWFGTGFGLNKFNGLDFDNYFEEHGLSSSNIESIYQSRDGKLWVGTDKGVNYVEQDSIFTDSTFIGLENSSVISIFEDSKGGLWFGTDGEGVWHYNQGLWDVYTTTNGFLSNQIRDIVEDESGALWFATRMGVTVLENGNFRNYTVNNGLPENRIRDLLIGESNQVWAATRNGVALFENNRITAFGTEQGLIDPKIHTLSMGPSGGIWLGTEGGISVFKNNTFKNYTTEEGLSTNIVYSSFTDVEGNIWFGTFGGGTSVFLGDYFENYTAENGLPNDLVTSFTEDQTGRIWIATYGGGLVSSENDNFEYLYTQQGLPDNRVYHVSTDRDGIVWIGMRDGLSQLRNGELYNFPKSEFPFRKIRQVNQASDGTHWISTYDEGLIHWKGNAYDQYTVESGLPNNTVIASLEDENGDIWVATYGGVAKISEGAITTYSIQEGVPNNGVMSIIKDEDGTIWISTFGGIAWFDGVQFVDITVEDGLPGRVCYFIEQDKNGIFWIGTNEGIARLDVEKFYSTEHRISQQGIQILTREQGLVGDETNLGAVFEDSKGRLWFGTVDGLSRFSPERYRGNSVPPIVHLLELNASGRDFEPGNLQLKHDRNFIEIGFYAINFTAPTQVIYEYRMHGIDPEWQQTSERFAKYPSLPPGDYTFQVHARNSSGVWSKEMASIKITIHPPFWMSWWFLILTVSTVIGIIYLFYRNYKYMKMVDIERMRVRIASDLHDDVGASLTEIALQSDFLQASSLNTELKQSLNQIGTQCRKIVTSLDDIVWSIDARNDTLGDLTDRMQDYILNVLEPKNFRVLYDFEELKMENKLPVPVKENLYLIFKEAVNNIAKYSNGDVVTVTMKSANNEFKFEIHDNGDTGKGMKKTGHGLRNMDMRAQRIGGSIAIDDKKGFKITLKGTLNLN